MPSPRFPVVPSVAPGYRAPQVAPSAAQIVGVTQQPFVGISLQDAIAMALLKNPNLAVSASNVRIARYTIVEVKGAYDVQLQLKPSSSFSVQPPENAFEAGPGEIGRYTPKPGSGSTPGPIYTTGPGNIIQHESAFQYGVGGQTENGLTYQAGIAQSRTYNNTVFNAYNPYYIATLNVALTQPLLKNAGMNATKRQLKLAFVNADASAAQALIDASSTIAQVENAYWNLVAAWRNVAIQEEALKEAIAQQQSNVRLGRRGALAPIEAVESQTQVSNFQDDVFSALQTVSQLQVAAQEPCRRRSRRRDLDRQPRALHFGGAASECGRSGADHRRRAPQSSGSASGAGQTPRRRHRSQLRRKPVVAAGRRASAIPQQRLRGYPRSGSRIFARRVL